MFEVMGQMVFRNGCAKCGQVMFFRSVAMGRFGYNRRLSHPCDEEGRCRGTPVYALVAGTRVALILHANHQQNFK
ncbi:hypothetical protein HJA95_00165 [Rhizobium binae]|uniref:hypothetical protein n=1 Tax=Rhizobium binae TaxID=1138190 RepID=UPI001C8342CD|nr:hypothetical protein [Rhizobium binae]MBX4948039.1 hypothetical protein [Rhizobium binae]